MSEWQLSGKPPPLRRAKPASADPAQTNVAGRLKRSWGVDVKGLASASEPTRDGD